MPENHWYELWNIIFVRSSFERLPCFTFNELNKKFLMQITREGISNSGKIKFNSHSNEFYTEVKNRVSNYFQSNNISVHADYRMVIKTIVLLGTFFSAYGVDFYRLAQWLANNCRMFCSWNMYSRNRIFGCARCHSWFIYLKLKLKIELCNRVEHESDWR